MSKDPSSENSIRTAKEPVVLHDSVVSRAYRELAVETTTAAIDEKMLRLAASETGARPAARLSGWFRPLAIVASLVLSVTVLLEVTRSPVPAVKPSVDQATPRFDSERQPSRPGQISGGDSVIGSSIAKDVQKLSEDAGKRAEQSLQALGTDETCEVVANQNAADWLSCIDALEREGKLAAARHQRQLLLEAHPGYSDPNEP